MARIRAKILSHHYSIPPPRVVCTRTSTYSSSLPSPASLYCIRSLPSAILLRSYEYVAGLRWGDERSGGRGQRGGEENCTPGYLGVSLSVSPALLHTHVVPCTYEETRCNTHFTWPVFTETSHINNRKNASVFSGAWIHREGEPTHCTRSPIMRATVGKK